MSGPSGTVTFLFTDIEGSTRLWQEDESAMRSALSRHDELLRKAVAEHNGIVFSTMGDGIAAAFTSASSAVAAALSSQQLLEAEDWPTASPIRVRTGLHTGEAELRDGDYFGTAVNRTARLMEIGHGGQVLVSSQTAGLIGEGGLTLVDLGEHRLRDLATVEHVFQVSVPGRDNTFPPLRSMSALPGNLPRQMTSFIGREAQLASLAELLRASTLVTLTGVGGVGKTRLALQVAADAVDHFPDGAWLCEFAPVTDPGAVWETVAASLRVQPFPGSSVEETVLAFLSNKRLLLLLDNCEHLLGALAHLADLATQSCPEVTILATSREGLGLGGERLVAVPSLGVPAAEADGQSVVEAEAVQLFAVRAITAKSDFSLSDANRAAVAELCRRLDGIPLAIELAAARVRSLTPEDLVARLDQRFKLLTRGSRAALERQQTLRATIAWSYDLLDEAEARGLNGLSVFAGGCELTAAEEVLADDDLDPLDVVDVLGRLVDKSLVVADVTDGGLRYRLLETIRQYAQEQLEASGDSAAVRRRHAGYFVALAEEAGPHLWTRDQVKWNEVVWRDIDNLRAAFDWAVETVSPEHALRLVAPLAVDTQIGDLAMEWAPLAIEIPGAEVHDLFPKVAAWTSWGALLAGDVARAKGLADVAERVQHTLGTPPWPILRNRAVVAYMEGDSEEWERRAQEWVDLARAQGNEIELAHSLPSLAGSLTGLGRFDSARATWEEAILVARQVGQLSSLGFALGALVGALERYEDDRAVALLDEAESLAEVIHSPALMYSVAAFRAWLALGREDWRSALSQARETAELITEISWLTMYAEPLCLQAGLALCELGRFEPAAVLTGKCGHMAQFSPLWAQDLRARCDDALLHALGREQVSALAARGAALGTAETVAYLREQVALALLEPE